MVDDSSFVRKGDFFYSKALNFQVTYHNREENGRGFDGLDDPENNETAELEHREQMDLLDRHVADVDRVRLVSLIFLLETNSHFLVINSKVISLIH